MTLPDSIPYRRLFPWLHLFRTIGMAVSLRQLIVAAGAISALGLGQSLLERLAPDVNPLAVISDWNLERETGRKSPASGAWIAQLTSETARPWADVLRSAAAVLADGETAAGRLKAAGFCFWAIAIWSLFGLAACRLAARQFTGHQDGSLRKAVQFGVTRWMHAVIAPLLPTAAAVVVMTPALLAAFAGRIPSVGPAFAMMAGPVVLTFGLAGAFLMIAVLLGWPLMVAAIATDDCDGFGGLSRSYSFWTSRPWYFAWCWIIVAGCGMVAMSLAHGVAHCTGHLTGLLIQIGLADTPSAPFAISTVEFLIQLGLRAYALSFFWTSATIIYAVLRQSVDGMPLDTMAPDDDERPPRDPLPVVGIPAVSPDSSGVAG
jgi:hypothetical protein